MRITKSEYSSIQSYMKKKSLQEFPVFLRHNINALNPKGSNLDLNTLGADYLTKLIAALPHGTGSSITSPILTSLKKKARQSLAGLRLPHLDPESWPQCWRMQMRLNNSRAGIKAGPLGQFYKLNPKARSLTRPLNGTYRWTQSEAGDLHIIGPWSDVSKMLGSCGARFKADFGDIYRGDVNMEFDRMYGAPKGDVPGDWLNKMQRMPLCVTVNRGAIFNPTDKEGEVVLNAPGEIVNLVGSKITGIAGAVGPETLGSKTLDTISEIKGVIEDHVIPVMEKGKELYDMKRDHDHRKEFVTISIGVGPLGSSYSVLDEEISASEVLAAARRLA